MYVHLLSLMMPDTIHVIDLYTLNPQHVHLLSLMMPDTIHVIVVVYVLLARSATTLCGKPLKHALYLTYIGPEYNCARTIHSQTGQKLLCSKP
jgi:hypothetical protein